LAAKRYAKYWKKRVEVLGPEKAFKPLRFDGNLDDVCDVIQMGVTNIIKCDSSYDGRTILYMCPKKLDKSIYTIQRYIKAFWYLIHVILENEETAKKGLIGIDFQDSISLAKADTNLVFACHECFKSVLPLRMSAYHICQPAPFMAMMWPVVKYIFGDRIFKRTHLHYGTPEKVLKSLHKFGLDDADIPEALGGNRVIDIKQWIEKRRMYEEALDAKVM
jgi:hypothetical protein